MLEHELDLGITHTGYRLTHFQLFNWGTFHEHTVQLSLGGENSLLTGANGSGKTTLVDALLTLLVPREYRTYNLSSGQEGKDGRSEESYVLGAYSTTKSESDYAANKEYLRDKSCHSIILGQFDNEHAKTPLTLMQIRYFTPSLSMQKLFVICEGELSLESMNDKGVMFDASNTWKNRFRAAFSPSTILFFDTFKGYSTEFASRVGFRDREKALRIFSQTVGMKDLSNLNEFIRTRMLCEMDMVGEFKKTLENFNTLMETKHLIEKDEEQIKQLRLINEKALEYHAYNTQVLSIQTEQQTLPLWEGMIANRFLEKEIDHLEVEFDETDTQLQGVRKELEKVKETILEISETLRVDERFQREERLKKERALLTNQLTSTKTALAHYMRASETLHLSMPLDELGFKKNEKHISSLLETIHDSMERLEDDHEYQANLFRESEADLKEITLQLDALGNRESNIPYRYIQLRSQLCNDLQIPEDQLPFVGELVQILEISLPHSAAIASLLRPLALSLLVYPHQVRQVSKWLWEHETELSLELIVIKEGRQNTEQIIERDQLSFLEDEEELFFDEERAPNRLDLMLEVKPSCPFGDFIRQLLTEKFSFSLKESLQQVLDDDASFANQALAHTAQGLSKGATKHKEEVDILGWDTKEKKAHLKEIRKQLEDGCKEIQSVIDDIRREKKRLENQKSACIRLNEFVRFEEIDTQSLQKNIDSLDDQLILLHQDMADISSLQTSLARYKAQSDKLEETRDSLNNNRGVILAKLERCQQDKEIYADQLTAFDLTQYKDQIEKVQEKHHLPTEFLDLQAIKKVKTELMNKLTEQSRKVETQKEEAKHKVELLMNSFIHPNAKLTQMFTTWMGEVSDFPPTIEALDMYQSMLQMLENEDLPKYKQQFASMRLRHMKSDIIDFNAALHRWEKQIKENIQELNESLQSIAYQSQPETRIRLTANRARDGEIRFFNSMLIASIPNAGTEDHEKEEADQRFFEATKKLLMSLQDDEAFCKKVLDVRRWFVFAVEEYDAQTQSQVRYYQDSAGISGGQKAKLAYTILAAAIAHQFDVFDTSNVSRSFRFVIVDEAFSKSDDDNSRYAMDLFKKMDLQLMVVTPKDKVNLVEPYIKSVQVTVCNDGQHSFVHSLTKESLHKQLGR